MLHRHMRVAAILVTLSWILATSVMGDEPTVPPTVEPNASAESTSAGRRLDTAIEQLEKRKKAYVGLMALAGIVIAGLSLGALTMIWAGRLRRELRRSGSAATARDRTFWFLSPPKPVVTDSSLPEWNRDLNDSPPASSSESESL